LVAALAILRKVASPLTRMRPGIPAAGAGLAGVAATSGAAAGATAGVGAAAAAAGVGSAVVGGQKSLRRAGLAGLAVSNAMVVTSFLQWAVRCFVAVEADMNSMERLLMTLEQTPKELAPPVTGTDGGGSGGGGGGDPGTGGASAGITATNGKSSSGASPLKPFDWSGVGTSSYASAVSFTSISSSSSSSSSSSASTTGLGPNKDANGNDDADDDNGDNDNGTSRAPVDLSSWPTEGRVAFQGVGLQYRAGLPLALAGVTFTAEPGQR